MDKEIKDSKKRKWPKVLLVTLLVAGIISLVTTLSVLLKDDATSENPLNTEGLITPITTQSKTTATSENPLNTEGLTTSITTQSTTTATSENPLNTGGLTTPITTQSKTTAPSENALNTEGLTTPLTTQSKTTVLPNIALGKPSAQSSRKLDYYAAYAVDGNRGTDLGVDKCSNTADGDTNPWWRVDLLAEYSITSVRILNRGMDIYGDLSYRLQDVTVTVGLTESDVYTTCGFFAGPGTASQLVAIDCLTSPQGRFVKISKTTEYLTLCEVDVFGVSV